VYDLAIVGGGINGCGIARDAAGRGYSVFLCEMGDLASGTSSRSTKLIHGGLRYLELFDFRLVRESLLEREVLWRIAPHIVRPMRFVLPHRAGLRPAWMLRAGLFLYDHLGSRQTLPGTRVLDLASDAVGLPLISGLFKRGFEYSDCWVDDARLVVLNARDAADRGAAIRVGACAISAVRDGTHWRVTLRDAVSGRRETIAAHGLVNAAGPWVEEVLHKALPAAARGRVRLVEGAHIVVAKLFDHDRAYLFQRPDGRVVFAIPYEGKFTLIGTTDRDYVGDPAAASATADEIAYLCDTANAAFAASIGPSDVVWSYSGVRPLFDDGAGEARAASRDYMLELDAGEGAPLLTIVGGKITIYRKMAEAVLDRILPHLPKRAGLDAGWTGKTPLPGGDFGAQGAGELTARLSRDFPFLGEAWSRRLVRAYGTRAWTVLGEAKSAADLGEQFGATLTEAEVRYLIEREWARSPEDILWRRSKLGLHMSEAERAGLEEWMRRASGAAASADASRSTPPPVFRA
jgi:glycerol-3-phosphate dehydrogenase